MSETPLFYAFNIDGEYKSFLVPNDAGKQREANKFYHRIICTPVDSSHIMRGTRAQISAASTYGLTPLFTSKLQREKT